MAEQLRFFWTSMYRGRSLRGCAAAGSILMRAEEAGMLEAADQEHLALALREGRVVVTQDADFLRLHAAERAHA
ncbi:hypothetical protein HRbin26_00485 [bacterium HR26]|nr:hypothetical protein HRbin26_00485 [bacterium HR26]